LRIVLDNPREAVLLLWTACPPLQRIHSVLQSVVNIVNFKRVVAQVQPYVKLQAVFERVMNSYLVLLFKGLPWISMRDWFLGVL
jgi:hypothetical protein